jgi:uncharacterized repeat protein (TIGR01451 family)
LIPLLLITLTVLFCAGTVSAADEAIFVNGSSGLDTNDGYSWNTAKLTIQNATGTVSSNGVVTIADGVYSGFGNTNITINQNMTIQGLSQTGTVIDGSGTNWIFNITSGVNVTFCNLTFTNATGYRGGAIYNHGDTTVENCTFTNNTATNQDDMIGGSGGAICNFADEGNVTSTVSNCIFNFNNGYRGSAIMNYCINDDYVISTITNCIFTNNTAGFSGTVYNIADNGTVICTVNNCTFTNNTATGNGGAIANYCRYSGSINATVTNSTFNRNHASAGGVIAIWLYDGVVNFTATSSTFTNNTAQIGGVVYCPRWNGGSINSTFHFNRFVGNTANAGSAIYREYGSVNATLNWWGTNLDPTTVTNLIVGTVDANPWVILTVNATPTTINNGETSAITADLNHINGGGDLVGGHIPDGPVTLDVPWGSFTNSGTSHSFTGNTVAGAMSATFYASEGALNPLFNPVKVTATADGYTTSDSESAYISINPLTYLNITKTANVTTANVGDLIRYNITITNNGPDNVTYITLEDILPLENGQVPEYVFPPADSLTYIPEGAKLTWTNILDSFGGILQPGQTISVLIDVRIPSSAAGTIFTNKANITSNVYPYFNQTTANVYVNQATVELNKTANNIRPNVGETVLFTIVAKNTGPSTASNLIVTDTLPAGLDFVSCTGGGVWDPVTRTVTWPAALVLNGANVTYYLTALVNSTSLAGTNVTNVVNETHAEYPNNSTTNCTVYVPKADLYIQITSDKNNPTVGETFTLRYKLGNNGPDDATNVTITIPLPEGFVISKIEGDGNWTLNGNTITWTMANVTVGDPNLYISGWATGPGNYLFTASIASDTFSINSMGISPLTLNAQPTVNAATTTSTSGNTVGMQTTGTPIVPLALAILSLLGGLAATRKNQ